MEEPENALEHLQADTPKTEHGARRCRTGQLLDQRKAINKSFHQDMTIELARKFLQK